jgi:hypothetical protein
MSAEGRERPELSSMILGSSQLVILPAKISARTGPVNLRPLSVPGTLYAATTEPIVSGI